MEVRLRSQLGPWLLFALLGAYALPVAAEPTSAGDESRLEEARAHFEEGRAAASAGNWAQAELAFRASLDYAERAATHYNLGLALRAQDKLSDARRAFDRAVELATADGDERLAADARAAAAELPPAEGSPGPAAAAVAAPSFSADAPAPSSGNPPAAATESSSSAAANGSPKEQPSGVPAPASSAPANATGKVAVVPSAAPPPKEGSTFWSGPGWLVVGGGTLVLSSLATGAVALHYDREVTDGCPVSGPCTDTSLKESQRRASQWATVTDVLWVSGAACAAAGLTWYLLDGASDDDSSPDHARASVSPLLSPNLLGGILHVAY